MEEKTHKNRSVLRNFICGTLIGGGSILPGVSGGVLAVVFGIYRPLMDFLANPKSTLRKHVSLLAPVLLGMATGFFVFAKVVAFALDGNTTITTWCFIGLIVGTLPSMERESRKEGRTLGCYVSFILCGALVLGSLLALGTGGAAQTDPGLLWYAVCGILLGLGSAVPGLSSSSVLMAVGMYAPMMEAVAELDLVALCSFVPWTVVTLLGLARFVTWVFDRYNSIAFHSILAIVLASTVVIIPTTYASVGEIILCGLGGIGGCALALVMVKMDKQL